MPGTSPVPSLPPDVGVFDRAAPFPPNTPGPWWPQDPNYQWHILAEGDSWFTIAALPSSNLLFELRFARWAQICNLAYPGDTIKHVGALATNGDLQRLLARPGFAWRWDALVLSGGGNDLIDSARNLIRPPLPGQNPALPQSYIDDQGLRQLLGDIQQAFQAIVALRDAPGSLSRGCPVVTHTYDYPTPRNEPARFIGTIPLTGPWLFPVFAHSGLGLPLQQTIVNLLMDRLAEALLALDMRRGGPLALPNFHVVDTRNTLLMANPADVGVSNDWLNEIHPSLTGYRKIAARLSQRLSELL
ncbi:SGNH/GDSL hydrolase family protein [Azohydromonas caseinilytica]|uniref:SGNH/GDSL hydrolase family protein n=1 Tax=Azohydromonas caseinilytica TaxID=2728836 RepID=A0A848FDM5_9BURK|nr:SGNH/GDSL hydrolase family protein [Azohydromonas caseinilytica]NML16915.1 SGNH/GDSL hydrolase family protein [Azohydromonas caseinilytica]